MSSLAVEQKNVIDQMVADFCFVNESAAHNFIYKLVPQWYAEAIKLDEENRGFPVLEEEAYFNGVMDGPECFMQEISFINIAENCPNEFPGPIDQWSEEQQEDADDMFLNDYRYIVSEMMHDIRMVLNHWHIFYVEAEFVEEVKDKVKWHYTPFNTPIVEVW